MAKNNIRSMRFSDTVIEMIEQQPGDTFTAKFDALVTKCCWELPKKEEQLADIQKRIDQEWDRLNRLQKATEDLRMLERDIKNAQFHFGIIERRAKAIAEAAEKDM